MQKRIRGSTLIYYLWTVIRMISYAKRNQQSSLVLTFVARGETKKKIMRKEETKEGN